MFYSYIIDQPLLDTRIWSNTGIYQDHHNLTKIEEALDDGESTVWFVHGQHNCDANRNFQQLHKECFICIPRAPLARKTGFIPGHVRRRIL